MDFKERSFAVLNRNLFLRIWSLGCGIIIARILGPVVIGIWYILYMIPNYAECFGRLKLDVASVYFLNKGKCKFGEVYFNLIVISVFSAVLIIFLLYWQRNFIFINLLKNSLSRKYLVYLMFLYIPINFMVLNYRYLFLATEDVKGFNLISIIPPVSSSILGIFFLLVFHWGVSSLVIATLIGGIFSINYGALRIKKTNKIIYHININMLKEFFNFSWKLYILGIIGHLQVYISGTLVAIYLLPKDVTFYNMGHQKALILSLLSTSLGTFLYPLVARKTDLYSREITAKICRINFLLLFLLAIIGVVFIKPFVYILYGKEFLLQIFPFYILLPGVIFYCATSILSQYFLGKGKPEILLKLSIIPLVFQISLCFLLVKQFGILGVSFATSFSYFIIGTLYIFIFSRFSKINIVDIIVPKKDDVILLTNFAKKRISKFISYTYIGK